MRFIANVREVNSKVNSAGITKGTDIIIGSLFKLLEAAVVTILLRCSRFFFLDCHDVVSEVKKWVRLGMEMLEREKKWLF